MDLYKVEYEQRADQIAHEIYGNVQYTKELIRANPILQTNPIVPIGTILTIPIIDKQEETIKGINLWS